jgi:hypothetical protein
MEEGGYGGELLFFFCICLQIADNNNICDLKCWRHKFLLCHIFGYKVSGKGSKFGYIKSIKFLCFAKILKFYLLFVPKF